jgi:carbon monoxide dehydrogenase subunit G
MQMEETERVPAPQAQVWAALNNPEILEACIPGCESLTMTSPTDLVATVVVKVGPVKPGFRAKSLCPIGPAERISHRRRGFRRRRRLEEGEVVGEG